MSSERTEKANSKRREDARKKDKLLADLNCLLPRFHRREVTINSLKQSISDEIDIILKNCSENRCSASFYARRRIGSFIEAIRILTVIVVPIMVVALGAGLVETSLRAVFPFQPKLLFQKPINLIQSIIKADWMQL